jgi:hypothetical protein
LTEAGEAEAPHERLRIKEADCLADIDRYAAEAGQVYWIMRGERPLCQLGPYHD